MYALDKQPELSPLDQIRQAEAEITRRIAAARLEAEQNISKVRKAILTSKNQALIDGQREGQARYKEIISEAESEAQAIVAQAHKHAKELEQNSVFIIDEAVSRAFKIVIGLNQNKGD